MSLHKQPLMRMSSVKRSINPPGGHMGGSAVYAGQCLAKGRRVTLMVESVTALRNLHAAPKVWSVVGRDVEMGFRKDKVKEAI